MSTPRKTIEEQALERERRDLLGQLEDWLETPMVVLGFVWLALLVVELVWGVTALLETLGTWIWVVFVLEFGVRFFLAPDKGTFLRGNWLTALSLVVPAFRVLRITRVVRLMRMARAARGLRLFRLVASLNRGMRALRATLGRRGFGYVLALTLTVIFGGAAGMYAFEAAPAGGPGLRSYPEALWWTAMLLTTLGSDFWPLSAEGRLLSLALSIYGLAVFGYITATLASFFIGRDAESAETELPSAAAVEGLRREVAALREQLQGQSDRRAA